MLESLLSGEDLSMRQATWAMEQVMQGSVSEAELAAWLIALRAKGETVSEIIGFRDAVLRHAVPTNLTSWGVDIVGTGGDLVGTVNVSTMAAFVIAAAGTPVLKHGGRASSSRSGSTDVLAELGVVGTNDSTALESLFEQTQVAFLFANQFHPGFAHAAPVRRALGVPTVFNCLGPLTNPTRAEASAVGVSRPEIVPLVVGVFRTRGAAALVFRGADGLDELTVTDYSRIWEVANGEVAEHDLHPRDVGLGEYELDAVMGGSPADNAAIARAVLSGEQHGAVRDIVLLNAAAGMVAFDLAKHPELADRPIRQRLAEKIEVARAAIDTGAAAAKLEQVAAVSQSLRVDQD